MTYRDDFGREIPDPELGMLGPQGEQRAVTPPGQPSGAPPAQEDKGGQPDNETAYKPTIPVFKVDPSWKVETLDANGKPVTWTSPDGYRYFDPSHPEYQAGFYRQNLYNNTDKTPGTLTPEGQSMLAETGNLAPNQGITVKNAQGKPVIITQTEAGALAKLADENPDSFVRQAESMGLVPKGSTYVRGKGAAIDFLSGEEERAQRKASAETTQYNRDIAALREAGAIEGKNGEYKIDVSKALKANVSEITLMRLGITLREIEDAPNKDSLLAESFKLNELHARDVDSFNLSMQKAFNKVLEHKTIGDYLKANPNQDAIDTLRQIGIDKETIKSAEAYVQEYSKTLNYLKSINRTAQLYAISDALGFSMRQKASKADNPLNVLSASQLTKLVENSGKFNITPKELKSRSLELLKQEWKEAAPLYGMAVLAGLGTVGGAIGTAARITEAAAFGAMGAKSAYDLVKNWNDLNTSQKILHTTLTALMFLPTAKLVKDNVPPGSVKATYKSVIGKLESIKNKLQNEIKNAPLKSKASSIMDDYIWAARIKSPKLLASAERNLLSMVKQDPVKVGSGWIQELRASKAANDVYVRTPGNEPLTPREIKELESRVDVREREIKQYADKLKKTKNQSLKDKLEQALKVAKKRQREEKLALQLKEKAKERLFETKETGKYLPAQVKRNLPTRIPTRKPSPEKLPPLVSPQRKTPSWWTKPGQRSRPKVDDKAQQEWEREFLRATPAYRQKMLDEAGIDTNTFISTYLKSSSVVSTYPATVTKVKQSTKPASQTSTDVLTKVQPKPATQILPSTKLAIKPKSKTQTQTQTQTQTKFKPQVKQETKIDTKNKKRINLSSKFSDKQKRDYIAQFPGAYTINMGELNDKRVWWTYIPKQKEPIIVMGRPPKGARITAKGEGSGYKTAQITTIGKPIHESRQIGFQKLEFDSDNSQGGLDVDFEPLSRRHKTPKLTPRFKRLPR